MRIGLLIYGSLDNVSGGYLYDRKLVEKLKAEGDEVEVISLPWRDYPGHILDNFSPVLSRRLQKLELDVLIQDELNHPSLFSLNKRLRNQLAYPIISLVHHLRISERHPAFVMPFYRSIEKQYLQSVDGYIFNSRTTKMAVEKLVGAGRPSVVANPAGDRLGIKISTAEIQTRSFEVGPLRLVFLGSVIPRKGLHILFDALEMINNDAWHLTVAGSLDAQPGYAKRLKTRAAANQWQQNVTFTGNLGDGELRRLLKSGHVLVMPSQYEGFGIAYLEGMAAGMPVIGSTNGAAYEIIRESKTGYLVDPDDAAVLAGHIRNLAVDRVLLTKMGEAARRSFNQFSTWNESMGVVRSFLVQLIA